MEGRTSLGEMCFSCYSLSAPSFPELQILLCNTLVPCATLPHHRDAAVMLGNHGPNPLKP